MPEEAWHDEAEPQPRPHTVWQEEEPAANLGGGGEPGMSWTVVDEEGTSFQADSTDVDAVRAPLRCLLRLALLGPSR